MVIESTVILVDNSEYQRNGDYFPNRLLVQKDGINFICQTRNRSSAENDIALISCSEPCQVLCTLMTDQAPIFRKLHDLSYKGDINLLTAIKIGHLTLKHRQAKQHKMRIIAFVGSPIEFTDTADFQQLAKRLKKEKVNVDIVSFGGHTKNDPMLTEFIEILNGKNTANEANSHLLIVPRGVDLVKALIESPILGGEGPLSADVLEFGFDPEADPELAFALRISREEEEQRQQLAAGVTPANATQTASVPVNAQPVNVGEMTEDEEFAYALRLSMGLEGTENVEMTDLTDNSNTPQSTTNEENQEKKK